MRGVSAPPGECRLSRQEGFTGGRRIWVVAAMYTVCAMRILVVSTFYPPVALGGYEVECAGVVERLRERNDVRVLTSEHDRSSISQAEKGVSRELALLSPNHRGALHAPGASLRAAGVARRALD